MKRKNGQKWTLIWITILGAGFIISLAFLGYREVRERIIQRERDSITSVAQICARDLEATLKEREERIYAVLSGNMMSEEEIQQNILKTGADGRYIRNEEIQSCEEWIRQVCLRAAKKPNMVISGPIRETEKGYVLYMTKSVYVNNRQMGYVVVEFSLDDIYQNEKALSELKVGDKSYILIKDQEGNTLIGVSQDTEDIEFTSDGRKNDSDIFLSYQVRDGVVELHEQKLVGYDRVKFSNIEMILCVVENYRDVFKPINRVAIYLLLFGLALLLWVAIFEYRILAQRREEERLKLELAYEKELNEANRALENQENLMQKYNHSKTMTVLTGALAHEFNNLMTPLVLYSDLLAENEVVMKEMPEEVQELKSSAERCEELARQLLDYSRQGRLERVLTNYNATFAVQSAVGIVKRLFPENIQFETDICKESYYVCGQIGTINQIILNLVNNAIQAIGDAPGIVRIQFGLSTDNERWVRLIVSDNGPGMPKEVARRIFEPFFSTKKEKEGSGIGLTVVQRLIGEHGGDIRVKSVEGEGTTFIIDFPLVDEK